MKKLAWIVYFLAYSSIICEANTVVRLAYYEVRGVLTRSNRECAFGFSGAMANNLQYLLMKLNRSGFEIALDECHSQKASSLQRCLVQKFEANESDVLLIAVRADAAPQESSVHLVKSIESNMLTFMSRPCQQRIGYMRQILVDYRQLLELLFASSFLLPVVAYFITKQATGALNNIILILASVLSRGSHASPRYKQHRLLSVALIVALQFWLMYVFSLLGTKIAISDRSSIKDLKDLVEAGLEIFITDHTGELDLLKSSSQNVHKAVLKQAEKFNPLFVLPPDEVATALLGKVSARKAAVLSDSFYLQQLSKLWCVDSETRFNLAAQPYFEATYANIYRNSLPKSANGILRAFYRQYLESQLRTMELRKLAAVNAVLRDPTREACLEPHSNFNYKNLVIFDDVNELVRFSCLFAILAFLGVALEVVTF